MTDVLAIGNAKAGSATKEAEDAALGVLREHHDVTLVTTSSPDELEDALAGHRDAGIIVVLGGDGSLHAVVAAVHAAGRLADVAVGLVPMGTGNDYARTLELPTDPAMAASVVAAGTEKALDLIVDSEGTVTVNAVQLGAGAEAAIAAQPHKARFGSIGYTIGALISGIRVQGKHLTITVDDVRVPDRGRVLLVAVGNGRFVGGGTALLPEADPSDGLMDVAVVFSHTRRERLMYALSLGLRRHHHRDDVDCRRGTAVTVEGPDLRCTNDGEISGPQAAYAWHVEPGALRMLVPEGDAP
jgi:YegS/Rv2252/BmrU family lipid kinase